jgi:hypothetical protein
MFTTSVVSEVYLFLSAAGLFNRNRDYGYTGALKTLTLVQGILFLIAGGIEVIGSLAALLEKIVLARIYAAATPISLGLTGASQLMAVIAHYTHQTDIINACTTYNTGRTDASYSSTWLLWPSSSSDQDTALTQQQASDGCTSNWKNGKSGVILALIIILFIGCLFMVLSFIYLRELVDPSSLRTRRRRNQQVEQVPLSQYAYNGGGQYPAYAPPPGPPPSQEGYGYTAGGAAPMPYAAGYGLPPKYERGDSPFSARDADAKELDGPYGYGAFAGSRDEVDRDEQQEQRRASGSRPSSSAAVRRVEEEERGDTEEEEEEGENRRDSGHR